MLETYFRCAGAVAETMVGQQALPLELRFGVAREAMWTRSLWKKLLVLLLLKPNPNKQYDFLCSCQNKASVHARKPNS